MNVHYSKEIPQAFVIGSPELQEVVALFEKHIGKVDVRVKCSDDFSRDFDTLKELIAYRNPKSKEIRRIHLTARSDDHKKSAAIAFVDSTWSGILIDFKGPEDTVFILKEETLDIIAGIRPWYNVISNFKAHMAISFILGIILGIINVFWIQSALGYKIEDMSFITFLRKVMPINIMITGIIFVTLYAFLRKPYKYLFPQAVFLIGQGESRFKHQQKVSWGVIIAFLVSLTAGLIIAILQLFVL